MQVATSTPSWLLPLGRIPSCKEFPLSSGLRSLSSCRSEPLVQTLQSNVQKRILRRESPPIQQLLLVLEEKNLRVRSQAGGGSCLALERGTTVSLVVVTFCFYMIALWDWGAVQ